MILAVLMKCLIRMAHYQGCFYPVQFLYPHKPRYKLRSKMTIKIIYMVCQKLKSIVSKYPLPELQAGDIIATRFRDELHVAIYYQYGKIIHVFKEHTLQIGRLKMFKEYKCYRVI